MAFWNHPNLSAADDFDPGLGSDAALKDNSWMRTKVFIGSVGFQAGWAGTLAEANGLTSADYSQDISLSAADPEPWDSSPSGAVRSSPTGCLHWTGHLGISQRSAGSLSKLVFGFPGQRFRRPVGSLRRDTDLTWLARGLLLRKLGRTLLHFIVMTRLISIPLFRNQLDAHLVWRGGDGMGGSSPSASCVNDGNIIRFYLLSNVVQGPSVQWNGRAFFNGRTLARKATAPSL